MAYPSYYFIRLYVCAVVVLNEFVVLAQQKGTFTAEVHPTISIQSCKTTNAANYSDPNVFRLVSSSCTAEAASLVLDANWWVQCFNFVCNYIMLSPSLLLQAMAPQE